MKIPRLFVSVSVALLAASGSAQEARPPIKLSPEQVKTLQQQEDWMKSSIEESKKHPGPTYTLLQCRADTQKWTTDPFDKSDERNLIGGRLIQVNGQLRTMPEITQHVTVTKLTERAYEMNVCGESDPDFEKQFGTYSLIARRYEEERAFRYVFYLTKHNLTEQFMKEDAEENR
jgi:hypothetical protein